MSTVTTSESPHLPMPSERPQAEVVIYDGNCRFCTEQVKRLARWDSRHCLSFISLHDDEVARRYPDLKREQLLEAMVVVDTLGRRHSGAAAFRHLTRRIPRLWWLAPLMHLPGTMPLWQWLYRQVARRRYWFGAVRTCDDGACRIHSGVQQPK